MSFEPSIVPATMADRVAVLEIAKRSELELDFDAELARPYAHLWVARAQEPPHKAIGFLLAWRAADELHLIDVATDPDFRRRGVARSLLLQLLNEASCQRARLVLLEVRRSNRAAISLYRSHGFRTMRVRSGYYDGGAEDGIELALRLDASGRVIDTEDEIPSEEI